MFVLLNGQFISEEQAVVPVTDRSFLYGDGLFESIPVYNGKPFRWAQHLERLARGALTDSRLRATVHRQLRVLFDAARWRLSVMRPRRFSHSTVFPGGDA